MPGQRHFIERSLMSALSFIKDSVFSDEYAAKSGFLQRIDPGLKLISIFLILLAVLFSKSLLALLYLYIFCLGLAWLSFIPIWFFLKRTWFFIPIFSLFIALPALFNIFTPGQPLVTLKIFSVSLVITRQGAAGAGFFFLRVLTSVSLCILLSLTTRHFVLLKVMRLFKVPQVFVMTLGMCYRYIFLFIEIIQNTYLAIKSRCGYVALAKRGQGIVAWNIAGLWQRSYALQNEVYSAMLSRGYGGEPKILEGYRPGVKDWLVLASAAGIFILSLWLNVYLN